MSRLKKLFIGLSITCFAISLIPFQTLLATETETISIKGAADSRQLIGDEVMDSSEDILIDVNEFDKIQEEQNKIRGDVNKDGKVTTDDAIYLLNHTTNSSQYPVEQHVDFDGSGSVTSDDAIYLLYHVMLPSSYPID